MLEIKQKDLSKRGFYDQMYQTFLSSVRYGSNQLQQVYFKEDLTFKDEWIITIEDLLHSVERIVKAPMRSIKDELELTLVEKAKQISSRTIRHLAIHSKDVASFEDGEIKPLKVLTKHMEEDLLIYENRLVFTLINRLIVFMEARYRKIKKAIDSRDITRLKVASTFKVGKNDVECDISFNVSEPQRTGVQGDNNATLLEKIEIIRKRLRIMQGTTFYKELSKTRPLNPPIIKTNALLMNRDYNNAYKLWLFISAYRESGFTVNVTEKQFTFDRDYYDDLTALVALGLRTMIANNALREKRFAGIRTRAKRVKRYRLGDDIVYEGIHKRQKATYTPDEVLNEYYYQAIKEQLIKSELLKEAEEEPILDSEEKHIEYERKLETTFVDFFKAIMRINNEIFLEKQGVQHPREDHSALESVKEIRGAIKAQRTRYNRVRHIATLKLQDVREALKSEGEELIALQMLFSRLAMVQTKPYKKVIAEDGALCKEVLLRAEKIVQTAQKSRDKHLQKALDRLKVGDTRRRLNQLKKILSNTEEEVREKLLQEFNQKILEAERKTHELAKSLKEKEKRKNELAQEAEALKAEIFKIAEDNRRYVEENKRLLQEQMQKSLEELARQGQEYERIVLQEKQALDEKKRLNEEEFARLRQEQSDYLAKLKAENDKAYKDGLAEAEKSKKIMLDALATKAKENKEYINTQASAIEQEYRSELAEIELVKAQNNAQVKALMLQIESTKAQRLADLESLRAREDKAHKQAYGKIEKDISAMKKELDDKLAKELAYLEDKKVLDEKYLQAEREWIEKQKAQKKAQLEEIEEQYAQDIREEEAKITALFNEEQVRVDLLQEDYKKQLLEQEQDIKEQFRQDKEALARKRRAYRKEVRETMSLIEKEKQKADMYTERLLEGKLALYPTDNINRVYKYVVVESQVAKDARQNRVRRAPTQVRSSAIRKWQIN